jgi:hypothetical protein
VINNFFNGIEAIEIVRLSLDSGVGGDAYPGEILVSHPAMRMIEARGGVR